MNHLIQEDDSSLAEVSGTFHSENYGAIHMNTGLEESKINRPAFDLWRKDYWGARGEKMLEDAQKNTTI